MKNQDNLANLSNNDLHSFKFKCLDFYIELCQQIKTRFNLGDKHLKFAELFNPQKVLSGQILSISEYESLLPNLAHLDVDKVNSEWQLLSEIENRDNLLNDSVMDFWKKVGELKNDLGELLFANVFEVAKCVLSLPHSSASAERVFSQLSLIKNARRNRVKVSTCSQILSVNQHLALNYNFSLTDKKLYCDVDNIVVE